MNPENPLPCHLVRTHGRHGDQIVIGDVVDILGVSCVSVVLSWVSWKTSAVVCLLKPEIPGKVWSSEVLPSKYIQIYPTSGTNSDHDQPNRLSLFPHCFGNCFRHDWDDGTGWRKMFHDTMPWRRETIDEHCNAVCGDGNDQTLDTCYWPKYWHEWISYRLKPMIDVEHQRSWCFPMSFPLRQY